MVKIQYRSWHYAGFFALAIICGVINGLYASDFGMDAARFISNVFIKLFKFISVPIIGITICTTISKIGNQKSQGFLWKRTLFYTLTTTILSATVAAIMYFIIAPKNIITNEVASSSIENKSGYLTYLENVVPSNIVSPILEGNVLSVLLIAIVIGIAIVNIKNNDNRTMVCNLLESIQEIAFYIVKFIIRLLPIGIFGFITISVSEFSAGVTVGGLSQYFAVVLSSNLIQGFLVLPLFMLIKRINPVRTAIKMFKALVVAFFTKSSAGTLPVTMQCAEQNNNIHTNVSRFVLPICTTINMNGCAAFIFITVLYLMQNHGIEIDLLTMVLWVGIATVAAIGNAGVPMGCYFLSASLLASMNIPIELLGLILPIYAIIDMVETALNVWSDSTVATMVDKDYRKTIG